MKKRWIATLLLVAASSIGILVLISFLTKSANPDAVGFGVFLAVISGLGLLSARTEKVDGSPEGAVRAYFTFLFKVLIALMPVMIFHWLSTHQVERLPLPLQVTVLTVWGCLLAAALLLIARPVSRRKVFASLERLGGLAPVAYSFNVLVISIVFFATASHLLARHGYLKFVPAGEADATISALTDFYLWNFMESVPLLDINETVRWNRPFAYEDPGVGWILLLFKLAVIAPVVAAFRGYWLHLQQEREGAGGGDGGEDS